MTHRSTTTARIATTMTAGVLLAVLVTTPAQAKTPDPDQRTTTHPTAPVHADRQSWALVQIGYRAKLDRMSA